MARAVLCWIILLCVTLSASQTNTTDKSEITDLFTTQAADQNATTQKSSSTSITTTTSRETATQTSTTTAKPSTTSTTTAPVEILVTVACITGDPTLFMSCEMDKYVKLLDDPKLSWHGETMMTGEEECVTVNDTCKVAATDNKEHWDTLMTSCEGKQSCEVDMTEQNSTSCDALLDYEHISYMCLGKAYFTTTQLVTTEMVTSEEPFSNSTGYPVENTSSDSGYLWLVLVCIGMLIIAACAGIVYVSWRKKRRASDMDELLHETL